MGVQMNELLIKILAPVAIAIAGLGITGYFQIQANAADLTEHVADVHSDFSAVWKQLEGLLGDIEANEDAINELVRGDDAMGAKLELELLKLQTDIEAQSTQLDTILRLLQEP